MPQIMKYEQRHFDAIEEYIKRYKRHFSESQKLGLASDDVICENYQCEKASKDEDYAGTDAYRDLPSLGLIRVVLNFKTIWKSTHRLIVEVDKLNDDTLYILNLRNGNKSCELIRSIWGRKIRRAFKLGNNTVTREFLEGKWCYCVKQEFLNELPEEFQ